MRSNWRRHRLILSALFVSLSVVLGYLLAAVPNVELMSLCVFIGGVMTGPGYGALTGALAITVFSLLNPYGLALPPLFISQVAGFTAIGLFGGILRNRIVEGGTLAKVVSAVSGFLLTLLYDILTTAAMAYIALGPGRFLGGIPGFLGAGLLFVAIHVAINTVLFSQAVVPIVKVAGFSHEDK